jgi:hypothetical protein
MMHLYNNKPHPICEKKSQIRLIKKSWSHFCTMSAIVFFPFPWSKNIFQHSDLIKASIYTPFVHFRTESLLFEAKMHDFMG